MGKVYLKMVERWHRCTDLNGNECYFKNKSGGCKARKNIKLQKYDCKNNKLKIMYIISKGETK